MTVADRPSTLPQQDRAVAMGRLAAVAIGISAVTLGVHVSGLAVSNPAWAFLGTVIQPLALALPIVMLTEVRSGRLTASTATAVILLFVGAALAYGFKSQSFAGADRGWIFLGSTLVPVGAALAALVLAQRLPGGRGDDPAWAPAAALGLFALSAAYAVRFGDLLYAGSPWGFVQLLAVPGALAILVDACNPQSGQRTVMAGAAVLVAAVALGAKRAAGVDSDQVWSFLVVALVPAALGLAILTTTRSLPRAAALPAGALVIAGSVALGLKVALVAGGEEAWVFLSFALMPLAAGCLVLVTASQAGDRGAQALIRERT